ncbi:putative GNAT family N-acyltransferase [Halarchaeum rubridurum]|uniref:Acetyltransferase n=1 Tax=Halarchaeum rubridurum TaxID=489911 RepID=A0A830FZH9_9EURY|nr:GNAT family N-acetyltransferase [Halarchaeum rubridurum]MBP1953173.1 putative GNAT family N-acyltransferase [Halarchaeum rubridurum]GGM67260.1 acetyltransferase [Halarchaeum rubridurum]
MHGVHVVETAAGFREALAVRYAVFVDEQGVPASVEVDDHEDEATHFLARVEGDPAAVGTARYRTAESGAAKIERVAVRDAHRGEGWGARLMDAVEAHARETGHDRAVLDAQTSAADFYAARGYERVGDVFDEAGIPHVTMKRALDG